MSKNPATAFEQLQTILGKVSDLSSASALLSWDQQTGMPPRGAAARGQVLATLSETIHGMITAPEVAKLLAEAGAKPRLSRDEKAWLREATWANERACKLPASLVRELSLAEAQAFEDWQRAKAAQKFALFSPSLKKLVALARQKAECFGYAETPWDALAQDFERGTSAARVTKLFSPLRDATVDLLAKIRNAKPVDSSCLTGKWPLDAQREFGMRVARDIGYDFNAGRLDVSSHPFSTTITAGDHRITTRYAESNLLDALGSIIHECGHALYEQGFNIKDARGPLYEAPSLGVHESQSRFWEVRIGQSLPFWRHYHPIIRQYFPGRFDDVTAEQLYAAVNQVEPDFIRVEADEITYNLHIIIRFELEVAILSGELSVDDIPAAWNEKYARYLGITVPNDAKGCLQDVHWAYGAFGYFPSYTLGNIYSAMLVEKLEADVKGLWKGIERGDFGAALSWLRENIHTHGRRMPAEELVKQATGRAPTVEPLIKYLRKKYGSIYGVR